MRQKISGYAAAIALAVAASAAPAMACGVGIVQGPCSPCGPIYPAPCAGQASGQASGQVSGQAFLAPAPYASGASYERLPDPDKQYYGGRRQHVGLSQYYYVNQGPTFSGPGDFAPYPTYQESAVAGWDAYRRRPYYYGYDGGRYADATTHYYDGAGIDGPGIYSYRARGHFRPRAHAKALTRR